MNRVTINLEALQHNFKIIDGWMKKHGSTWTLVTKVLCGHQDTIKGLEMLGVRSMADSRLANLETIKKTVPDVETWYLRIPHMPAIPDIVRLADVSLATEEETIYAMNEEAKKQDKMHKVIVMIELGDLREGILPGKLVEFYQNIFELSNIEVWGIGANIGCLSGTVPNVDQLTQLMLYRELLELKFQRKLPMISAGASVVMPLLLDGKVPREINNFRIGEALYLGTDLINGGALPGLRDDAVTVEADIAEIKEKSLVPLGETTSLAPFETFKQEDTHPGERGVRAVITMGQLDTEIAGLMPIHPDHQVVGASSDLAVVSVKEREGLKVGDTIRFRPTYGALVRLMIGKYVAKQVIPSLDKYQAILDKGYDLELPPVMEQVDEIEEEDTASGTD